MPKLNTTVKAVRIDNGILEELEKILSGQTINSWLNQKIEEEVRGLPSKRDLPYEIDSECLDDMATMAGFMGGSVREMIRLFDEALNEGAITYVDGRYRGVMPEEYERFEDVCHDKGLDPVKVLERASKAVEKGEI